MTSWTVVLAVAEMGLPVRANAEGTFVVCIRRPQRHRAMFTGRCDAMLESKVQSCKWRTQ